MYTLNKLKSYDQQKTIKGNLEGRVKLLKGGKLLWENLCIYFSWAYFQVIKLLGQSVYVSLKFSEHITLFSKVNMLL